MRDTAPGDERRPRFPIIGVAVNVRSLYNIGALFRAADAARLAHLHLTGGCGHPGTQRERIEKTALGTTTAVPWSYALDPLPVIAGLRAAGVTVCALELTAESEPLARLGPTDCPLALVVGHETLGVPPEVLAACDRIVKLTTYGRKPSLNVALAFGVAVMELAGRWAAREEQTMSDVRREAFFLEGQDPDTWPYSEALRVGDWVYIAGQGPVDPKTQQAVNGTIESETRLVFDHLKELLERAGSSLEEVVKVTVHLADINDFDAYNAIYREYFPTPPRPVRITCQSGLWSGIKIEVECTAHSPR